MTHNSVILDHIATVTKNAGTPPLHVFENGDEEHGNITIWMDYVDFPQSFIRHFESRFIDCSVTATWNHLTDVVQIQIDHV